MRDRFVQFPTRYELLPVPGMSNVFDLIPVPGIVYDPGTSLNKHTWLADDTAAGLGLTGEDNTPNGPTVNNAIWTLNTIKAETVTYTASVDASWTENDSGGYYKTVSVPGILPTDNPFADLVLGSDISSNRAMLQAWACVDRIVTDENSITLYAYNSNPQVAVNLQLKVVR